MYAFGSCLVNASDHILIDLFGDERHHRCSHLAKSYDSGIKGHISVYLILAHALCPVSFSASSYIPVGQIVNKLLHCLCSLGDPVICQVLVGKLYHGVHL